MNQRDLGWLEGIIDGEGSICLLKTHVGDKRLRRGFSWAGRLMVYNTNAEAVDKVRKLIGAGVIQKVRPGKFGRTPFYSYTLSSNGMRSLLPMLLLTIKEKQRVRLIEALELIQRQTPVEKRYRGTPEDVRLEQLFQEVKALNHTKMER